MRSFRVIILLFRHLGLHPERMDGFHARVCFLGQNTRSRVDLRNPGFLLVCIGDAYHTHNQHSRDYAESDQGELQLNGKRNDGGNKE
jgi:hypothetical protein